MGDAAYEDAYRSGALLTAAEATSLALYRDLPDRDLPDRDLPP